MTKIKTLSKFFENLKKYASFIVNLLSGRVFLGLGLHQVPKIINKIIQVPKNNHEVVRSLKFVYRVH